jgi:hypothetical protein
MTKKNLNTVLALLPKLSAAERTVIASRLEILEVGEIASSTVLIHSLVSSIVYGFPPLHRLQRSSAWKQFVQGSQRLERFVAELFPGAGRCHKPLLLVFVKCVMSELDKENQSPSPMAIAAKFQKIDQVVWNCLPGYMMLDRDYLAQTLLRRFNNGVQQSELVVPVAGESECCDSSSGSGHRLRRGDEKHIGTESSNINSNRE